MTTIKTEGFIVPGAISIPQRPHITRPFTDGSMTIETDVLASLDSQQSLPIPSHFFPQSLPNHFSPHSPSLDLNPASPHGFHPSLFTNFKFENPEPPITFAQPEQSYESRPRSLSSSRSSLVAKRGGGRQPARKLSMSDTRPVVNRGRPVAPHPRTMSHSGTFPSRGLGIALQTHNEGERTDSISPPEYNPYGISIGTPWNGHDTAPSLVSGSFGSYSMPEEAIMDSPMTPAQALPSLDDSYKKQRRRECHNQVEKRRREHINAKIEELSQLLPAHYNAPDEVVEDEEDEEPSASPVKKKKNKRSGSTAKQQKDAAHCKGRILSQSVQYIYDLKHITEMQAARIQQLESMLSLPPQQYAWPNDAMGSQSHGVSQLPDLATLAEHSQLDMSQSSGGKGSMPSLHAPWHASEHGNHPDGLMAFQPSPTDQSSGSGNNLRRSSSLSTSESERIEGAFEAGILGSPDDLNSPRYEGGRKISDAGLHLSMSGMDIDAMFGRRDEINGLRW